MQYRFNKILENYGIEHGASVLVALSGGVDSMILLMLLSNSSLQLNLYAAHVNFHLRGEESNSDEMFVRQWCSSHNIKLLVKQADTIAYSQENKLSIEMAAREIRYNWFYQTASENNIKYLAVAHNANDNAETLLLNLLRGCGLEGCTAIKEERTMSGIRIIRPIISFTRKEIEHCARNLDIPFRTDSTNTDTKYSRNKIRHKVIPVLEQINPSAVKSLNKSISYLSQANNLLNSVLEAKTAQITGNSMLQLKERDIRHYPANCHLVQSIEIKALLNESEPELCLHYILEKYGFSASHQEQLCKLLNEAKPAEFVSGHFVAQKERGLVKIYSNQVKNTPTPVVADINYITPDKNSSISNDSVYYRYGDFSVSLRVVDSSEFTTDWYSAGGFKNLAVDYGKCSSNITIGMLGNGDRLVPFGMRGSKKVADILSDLKVDLQNKRFVPILRNSGNNSIIAVAGVIIDNSYRITSQTEKVLLISLS